MFKFIYDPSTNLKHSVYSKEGSEILKKYLSKMIMSGGASGEGDEFLGDGSLRSFDEYNDLILGGLLFNPIDLTKNILENIDWPTKIQPIRSISRSREGELSGELEGAFAERWDQMICQLGYHADNLFKLNPAIKMSTMCNLTTPHERPKEHDGNIVWESTDTYANLREATGDRTNKRKGFIWDSIVNSSVDLEIGINLNDATYDDVNEEDDNTNYTTPDGDAALVLWDTWMARNGIPGDGGEDPDSIQVGGGDGEHRAWIASGGILDTYAETMKVERGKNIFIIKIGIPGHYIIAIFEKDENLITFFDSGGWSTADGNPTDESELARGRRSSLRSTPSADEDPCGGIFDSVYRKICRVLRTVFTHKSSRSRTTTPKFVIVNSADLQLSDNDEHCQTWVLLYCYLRFIYPRWSIEEVDYYFNFIANSSESDPTKTKSAAFYEVIYTWWQYLINLKISNTGPDGGVTADGDISRRVQTAYSRLEALQ